MGVVAVSVHVHVKLVIEAGEKCPIWYGQWPFALLQGYQHAITQWHACQCITCPPWSHLILIKLTVTVLYQDGSTALSIYARHHFPEGLA